MKEEIKAIETTYNGYKFRSRTEARWAVFFDTLGINYEYEKEGFDLNGTWYLPDFYIPFWDMFIEIKGTIPTAEERVKCIRLGHITQRPVFLIHGTPGENYEILRFMPDPEEDITGEVFSPEPIITNKGIFLQCRRCPEIFLAHFDSNGNPWYWSSLGHPEVAEYMKTDPRHECTDRAPLVRGKLQEAVEAAKRAQFEFGKSGN